MPRFKEEIYKLRARRQTLERRQQDIERLRQERLRAQDALAGLETFCQRVSQGLEHLTFEEKQKLLYLVVDRIVVDGQHVRIEAVIPVDTPGREVALCPTRPVD